MPLAQPKITDAVSSGVRLGAHRSLLFTRGAARFGVEVQHQPENQGDQPEQCAEHDELAHNQPLPR